MFPLAINNKNHATNLFKGRFIAAPFIAGIAILLNIAVINSANAAENFVNVNLRGIDTQYIQSTLPLSQLKQSVLAGDSRAQFIFGHALLNGKGIKKDTKNGIKWIEKAAVQGAAIAQFQLGLLLEYGQGIAANHQTAAQWHLKAAEQGNIGAQHSISMMYLDGKGVEKNLVNAYAWMSVAFDNGYQEIKPVRDHIKTQLNDNQQLQAQVRMKAFKNDEQLSEHLNEQLALVSN